MFFFFKQKTAYEMRISDWSSDVCSSDLPSASRAAGFERSCMILGRKGVNRCTGRTGSRLTTGLVEGREGLPQKLFDALTLGGLHRCPQHPIGERLGGGLGCGDPGLEVRTGVVLGKDVSVRVNSGGRRTFEKTIHNHK